MSTYKERLKNTQHIEAREIIEICKALLPKEYYHRPYCHPELKNGTALLQTEDGMNAYMAAYGEMHISKCRAAMQNFPYDQLQGTIEIVDWGCGQGIGSLCVLEALSQREKLQWVKRVTLIEPSSATLDRAFENVKKMTNGWVTILCQNCYLPDETDVSNDSILQGVDYSAQNVIHVFSNILDIDGIDLKRLACMTSIPGHTHYILCMGPCNANAPKIDFFCGLFGAQSYFSDICSSSYGRTSDTFYQYTCKTKCFVYDGSPLQLSIKTPYIGPVYYEYDPRLSVQNGLIPDALRRLYLWLLYESNLTEEDTIIIKPDINGDRPDMVVVRPHKGILIINLFEEDLKQCKLVLDSKGNEKIVKHIEVAGKKIVKSPFLRIGDYQDSLLCLLQEGNMMRTRQYRSIVKKMILFTQNTVCEVNDFLKPLNRNFNYTCCCGKDLLSDRYRQNQLKRTLGFLEGNSLFDDNALNSICHKISSKWHSYKEGKFVTLTPSQSRLAVSMPGKKQKISGVAGSGKTQVLATRAVNAQIRTGRKVLVLTFNKTLVNYMRYRLGEIRADFPWDKIVIDNYHSFFKEQANNLDLHVSCEKIDDRNNGFDYDNESFFEQVSDRTERFSAIFIDEVQDYRTEWLKLLDQYFLEKDGEFVVFGDPKQNIYNRPFDSNGDIRLEFIPGAWNHELKERQRFTNPQLANLATAFQSAFYSEKLPIDIFDDTSQSSMFSRIKYTNIGYTESMDVIGDTVRQIMEENQLSPNNTVILSQEKELLKDIEDYYHRWSGRLTTSTFASKEQLQRSHDENFIESIKKLHFTTDTDYLKMATIHSFKGWESSNVIFILEPVSNVDGKYCCRAEGGDSPELIYTAITRAKENLFIINLGNNKYHNFLSKNMVVY